MIIFEDLQNTNVLFLDFCIVGNITETKRSMGYLLVAK